MTMTPWGESAELRERRLQPGPGVPRKEVEENQRERLYGATVAAVANKGYGKTTVSDLIELAGVSRTTFYRYFDDKEACFLKTLELLLVGIAGLTRVGLQGEGSWQDRSVTGMQIFIGVLVTQADAARICVVESDAAGPKAVAMVDEAAAEFGGMLVDVFEELPDQRGMPKEIIDVMVGGVRKVLQTRLQRRTEAELIELVPALVELGLSYRPPPRKLPDRASRGKDTPTIEVQQGIDEPAQRMERAAMGVIAEVGYGDATMAEIARRAKVSLATLYANFEDKSDLFEAALLRCRLRMLASVMPAYRRASTWPEGMAALTRASLAFLEAEPDFARLITVDVHGVGNASVEARDRALDATRHFIEAGLAYAEIDNPVAAEAIQSALYSMLAARVRSRHKNLRGMAPLAIYVILAPFLGRDEAYKLAVR
ncbi:MAG TPA: TetR/AcrR family transcriptional regulator [Solirubrobacterales bacterium]|nr:TetR/AcrR family transcriptional regulator [Solirubrobacterales bacterium]